jgi:hypothetical protein
MKTLMERFGHKGEPAKPILRNERNTSKRK